MVARRDLRLRYRRPCGGACRRFAHDDAARSIGAAAWHQLRAPSADQASIGNPALAPYLSTNLDLGFEYYTGREGVISFNAFRKSLEGFTTTAISTVPFSNLAQYGITYDTLNPTQQIAINSRGGPGSAQVQVTSQVNVPNKLTINGLEFQWVQPLDFLTRSLGITGFGFNANATIVDQRSDGPAIAFGVAPSPTTSPPITRRTA